MIRTQAVLTMLLLFAPSPASSSQAPSDAERREIVATLSQLEEQWIQVYATHDLELLERLIADDFVATLDDGTQRGKREHIAAYPQDFAVFATVANSDVRVRVYTRDIGVATGLYAAVLREGGSVERYRWTGTWLRRNGAWQCIATQKTHVK